MEKQSQFTCCGDADFHPFRCPRCELAMVFCYECGTLYPALPDTAQHHSDVNHSDAGSPCFECPRCGYAFEYYFMPNPACIVTRAQWTAAGLNALLRPSELLST